MTKPNHKRNRTFTPILAVVLLGCALTACNRTGPEAPTAVDENAAPPEDPNGIGTVEVKPDAAFVGPAIDASGDLVKRQHDFPAGSTMYVSVPSKGRTMGSRMEVFWFGADGRSRKEEHKNIEGPFTAFEFQPADPGKYNVEVDVNSRPIAMVEFEAK